MNLKKIVAAAVSTVMACIFAVGVMAASQYDTWRADANQFLAAQNVSYTIDATNMTDAQIDALIDAGYTIEGLKAMAAQLIADVKDDKANTDAAVATANSILSVAGITIGSVDVQTATNGDLVFSAPVSSNGTTSTASTVVPVAQQGEANKPASAAAAATSSTSVIKATGDNAAVLVVVAALAVAGVLGLAVRKNNSIA